MAVGAFLAAFAIEVFLIPNRLIDGGTVGIAMILGNVFGTHLIPAFMASSIFRLPIWPIVRLAAYLSCTWSLRS